MSGLRISDREYIGRDDYTFYGDVVCKFKQSEQIDTLYFDAGRYNAGDYVVKGLSNPEEWGTWTEGEELVLSMPLQDIDAPFVGISMDISTVFNPPQSVTILVNGEFVCQEIVRDKRKIEFALENPGMDVMELTLLFPDAVTPAEITGSEDDRRLALGLLTMEVANKQQEISIEINGELAFAGTVDQGTVSFEVPYPQDETIGMVIHMPDAGSETDAKTSCLMIKDIQFSITASSGLR